MGTTTASAWKSWTAAFIERPRELGWIEGSNVAIEYLWAEARNERFAVIASGFVRLNVDVIVTGGNAALAVKQTTSAIPIIFVLAVDPVRGAAFSRIECANVRTNGSAQPHASYQA